MPSILQQLIDSINDTSDIRAFNHLMMQPNLPLDHLIEVPVSEGKVEQWSLLHLVLSLESKYRDEKFRKIIERTTTHLVTPIMRGEEKRETLLQMAIDAGSKEAVSLILTAAEQTENKQIIAESFSVSKRLPAQYAIVKRKGALLPLLITRRNINLPDQYTPLEQACISEDIVAIRFLLKQGARVALTAIDAAKLSKPIKKLLLPHLLKQWEDTLGTGNTPLHLLLLNNIENLDELDYPRRGETPEAMIKMFLALGYTDIDKRSDSGKTPLALSVEKKCWKAFNVLWETGKVSGVISLIVSDIKKEYKKLLLSKNNPISKLLEDIIELEKPLTTHFLQLADVTMGNRPYETQLMGEASEKMQELQKFVNNNRTNTTEATLSLIEIVNNFAFDELQKEKESMALHHAALKPEVDQDIAPIPAPPPQRPPLAKTPPLILEPKKKLSKERDILPPMPAGSQKKFVPLFSPKSDDPLPDFPRAESPFADRFSPKSIPRPIDLSSPQAPKGEGKSML